MFISKKTVLDKTILSDNEISLEVNWVNRNEFGFYIVLKDTEERVGQCDLRMAHNESMYYYGNIGYRISPQYRGHNFSYKACLLLLNLARNLNMDYLILTVSPENEPSKKTIEKLGSRYIETVDVPVWHSLYKRGETVKLIYRLDL